MSLRKRAKKASLLEVPKALKKEQIFPKRYLYPSLNTLSYVATSRMGISEEISKKIFCLPVYKDMEILDVNYNYRNNKQ